MTLRVLLVAPRKGDLGSVDEEVQDILSSGLEVKTLLGKVSATDVIREVRENQFDVLWLATHGDNAGVELSGLERITAAELVPLVRGRFKLVVLNTCNGFGIAKMIQIQANVGVICSAISVPDTSAYKFGSNLSSALVEQATIADAYLASLFGNDEIYHYFPALKPSQDSIDTLVKKIDELTTKVDRDAVASEKLNRLLWRVVWFSGTLHVAQLIGLYLVWRL